MKGTEEFPGCSGHSEQLGESMMGGVVFMAAAGGDITMRVYQRRTYMYF